MKTAPPRTVRFSAADALRFAALEKFHWVTIDGNHVDIGDKGGGSSTPSGAAPAAAGDSKSTRKQIHALTRKIEDAWGKLPNSVLGGKDDHTFDKLQRLTDNAQGTKNLTAIRQEATRLSSALATRPPGKDEESESDRKEAVAVLRQMALDAGKALQLHATLGKHSEHFSEGGNALRGVDIFAAGSWRGKTYTTQDLDDMVANFDRSSRGARPGFRCPLVVGHDESQEFLERSDLPAAGWASRVYRDGDILKADFEDVAPKIARLIKTKRYRTVSAEIYDSPPDNVPGSGKMLRRVALLGGDIPQVKDLADIPEPEEHAERFARHAPHRFQFHSVRPSKVAGAYHCFSEVRPMDKEEMLKKCAEHGSNVEAFQDAPDAALAEHLRMMEAKDAAQAQMGQQQMDEEDGDGADDYSEFDETDPDAYEEPGDDEGRAAMHERLRKYVDHVIASPSAGPAQKHHASRYMERFLKKHAEPEQAPAAPPAPEVSAVNPGGAPTPKKTVIKQKPDGSATTTHHFSEEDIQSLRAEIAELKATIKGETQQSIEEWKKFREEYDAAENHKSASAIADAFIKEGKLPPSEREDYIAALTEADTAVRKFSEGGKVVSMSPRDRLVRMVNRRSSIFAERFKSPASATPEDSDIAEVEAHFEQFREEFKGTGYTKEKLVEGFKAEKKARPELTARAFLQK